MLLLTFVNAEHLHMVYWIIHSLVCLGSLLAQHNLKPIWSEKIRILLLYAGYWNCKAGGRVQGRYTVSSPYWRPKIQEAANIQILGDSSETEGFEQTNTGGVAKHDYHKKRPCYEIDRSQRNTPFKKRRLFDRNSVVTYDGGISCESVSNSPGKIGDDDNNTIPEKLDEGNGKFFTELNSLYFCNSSNSQVRLSIKSFKVPQLFVEVPESITVGSLKEGKFEMTTELCFELVYISQNDDMDTVGFMLEPNSPKLPSPPISPKEPSVSLLCHSPKFSQRSEFDIKKDMFLLGSLDKPSLSDSNSLTASSRDRVPSTPVELPEKDVSDSKALVPVPGASMKALAVLPMIQRTKRSDSSLKKVSREIQHSRNGVTLKTEDGSTYEANHLILSVSIGVLQSRLISFHPPLLRWKKDAIDKCDVMVYTEIFLKFPYKFWPSGEEKEFFIYAHERRGYYTFWQLDSVLLRRYFSKNPRGHLPYIADKVLSHFSIFVVVGASKLLLPIDFRIYFKG